jgi:energy-converting hydrogenase Eha subunit C
MPNLFAYFMLMIWPVVTGWLFAHRPPHVALIWSILGGYLLLPMDTGFNPPMLPTLDKTTIPAMAALAFCLFSVGATARPRAVTRGRAGTKEAAGAPVVGKGWLPQAPVARILLFALFASGIMTVITNTGAVDIGAGKNIRGLGVYDMFSTIQGTILLVLPYIMARRYIRTAEHHEILLKIFLVAGLAYSLPMALEIRISPQLHRIVYGFFSTSFLQQIRYGGYRPVVFLEHGIWAAGFMAMTLLAAAGVWRIADQRMRGKTLATVLWLAVILVLCKTVSALLPALLLLPVLLLARPRVQITVAALVCTIVIFYPALRGLGVVQADTVLNLAQSIVPEKVGSLGLRLRNEDALLAHTQYKPLFGWGGWNRWRVFDPETGDDMTVSDGVWTIIFSTNGWVGYIARFGLLTVPSIMLWTLRRRAGFGAPSAALALILSINLIDLLPNASLTPVTWLLAGALLGRVEALQAEARTQTRRSGAAAGAAAAGTRGGGDSAPARGAPVRTPAPPAPSAPPSGPVRPSTAPIRPVAPRSGPVRPPSPAAPHSAGRAPTAPVRPPQPRRR